VAGQAPASATLTVSIKGSTAYAQPTPVPLQTALLVVTPAWEDLSAKSPLGGKEAAGQPLFLSDLAVVLSNKALDCTTVFTARQAAADQDLVIVVGKAEAYTGAQGYHGTTIGKVIVDTSGGAVSLPLDRFSADAQFTAQKRKSVSKDNLRGNDGRLNLQRTADGWIADVLLKADELSAEGKIPLTACGMASRKKASTAPLLGEKRLLAAAERYGL
jgi:hypothetical protein